jgi:hypothetical protein
MLSLVSRRSAGLRLSMGRSQSRLPTRLRCDELLKMRASNRRDRDRRRRPISEAASRKTKVIAAPASRFIDENGGGPEFASGTAFSHVPDLGLFQPTCCTRRRQNPLSIARSSVARPQDMAGTVASISRASCAGGWKSPVRRLNAMLDSARWEWPTPCYYGRRPIRPLTARRTALAAGGRTCAAGYAATSRSADPDKGTAPAWCRASAIG